MAEYTNRYPFDSISGYYPDIESTRLDLYRLLNQFLASKKLSDMCIDDGWLNHMMESLDHFFEIEATRILLSSAVIARVIDDRDGYLNDYETTCGSLIPDLKFSDQKQDLKLREACNKIIHAKTIRYDIETDGRYQRYLNPYIYYYGKHQKKEWKAILNVVDYVKHYTNNVVH